MKPDYIPSLDGLRAIAVLLVLWAHFPALTNPFLSKLLLIDHQALGGYLGVDIFFVLSGFLITRILLNNKLCDVSLLSFFIRRSLRIFPVYYLVIAVLALIAPSRPLWWCATYLSNFYFAFDTNNHFLRHTWSLAVEEHFYLVWPFIVYHLPARSSSLMAYLYAPALAILCALFTLAVFSQENAAALIYRGSMFRMMSLAAGAALAYNESLIRDHLNTSPMKLAVIFSAIGVCTGYATSLLSPLSPLLIQIAGTLFSLGVVLLVIWSNNKYLKAVLGCRSLKYIGSISYGLYLYHYIIYEYFGMLDGTAVETFTAISAGILSFLVASISFIFFEKPILKLYPEILKAFAVMGRETA